MKGVLRVLDGAEHQAAAAAEKLKEGTEQIGKIHQDLEEIDGNIKLAQGELTRYVRRMATDKIVSRPQVDLFCLWFLLDLCF